jgi:Short C-terminal domain/Phospholipase_D-nuclease N-terminal
MLLATDYPFLDIVGTMLVFFGFVIWLWLLFAMFGDLFRRHDVSGWAKAGWTVLAIVLPFIGVLIYLGTQGPGMAERKANEMRAAQAQFDEYVRKTAGSEGPAAEIGRAKELLDSGAISQAEFEEVKRKALAA